jgi:hypothetical protein
MKIKCKGKFVETKDAEGNVVMVCERCGVKDTHTYYVEPCRIAMSDRAYSVDRNGTFRRVK